MMDNEKISRQLAAALTGLKEATKEPEPPELKAAPVEAERIKGDPVRLFSRQTANALSDSAVDLRQFNAAHVVVLVTGTTPSATVSLEGAEEEGGNYIALPGPNASQTVTANVAFDVMVGSAFAKVRIASISGTFASGQGYTVIVTPYRAGGQANIQVVAALPTGTNVIGQVEISGVIAAKLQKGKQIRTTITCTSADTDYAAAAKMPAGTTYVWVYCVSAARVALGEATSATCGVDISAGNPVVFPVVVTGTAADDTVHAQSSTAAAVVMISYLQD